MPLPLPTVPNLTIVEKLQEGEELLALISTYVLQQPVNPNDICDAELAEQVIEKMWERGYFWNVRQNPATKGEVYAEFGKVASPGLIHSTTAPTFHLAVLQAALLAGWWEAQQVRVAG